MGNPVAMERIELSRRTVRVWNSVRCPAGNRAVGTGGAPGITCVLGQAQSLKKARSLVLAYRNSPNVEDSPQIIEGMVE